MPYTSHGHWYGPGSPTKPGPRYYAKCMRFTGCDVCMSEAGVPAPSLPQSEPVLPVQMIAQRQYLPAWQVAELFGLPESEVRERYGDTVPVLRDLMSLTVLPPVSQDEEADPWP